MKKILAFIEEAQRTSKTLFSLFLNLIRPTKRSSKILLGLWILFNIAGVYSASTEIDNITSFCFTAFLVSTMLFFIPAIIIEYRAKNPERYISKALIASIVCLFYSFLFIGLNSFSDEPILGPIIVSILLAVVFFSISRRAPKTKAEAVQRHQLNQQRAVEKKQEQLNQQRAVEKKQEQLNQQATVERHEAIINTCQTDPLFIQAVEIILQENSASVSTIQRNLRLGYVHAIRLIDEMEKLNIVGPNRGATPRKILINSIQWNKIKQNFIPEKETEDHSFETSHTSIEDISFIDGMEGHKFEYFCADLLRNHGFTNVEVTPGSGDQGVDIIAIKDDIRYAIQCKNYTSRLGNTPIQEIYAGKKFYRCHVGVVMTNSYFTSGAIALARETGTLLWDRDKVKEMMKNHQYR